MLSRLPKPALQELISVLAEKVNTLDSQVFAGLLVNAFI